MPLDAELRLTDLQWQTAAQLRLGVPKAPHRNTASFCVHELATATMASTRWSVCNAPAPPSTLATTRSSSSSSSLRRLSRSRQGSNLTICVPMTSIALICKHPWQGILTKTHQTVMQWCEVLLLLFTRLQLAFISSL